MEQKPDERQLEFPFVLEQGTQRMEASYKVRTYDCSKDRHQVRPNGVCMWCKQQVSYGNQDWQ